MMFALRLQNLGRNSFALLLVLTLVGANAAQAERKEPAPGQLEGVGVEEHLNAKLPLADVFRDSRGHTVRLGDLFDGRRPVILSLNYSDCPMLCNLQLNGLIDTLRQMDWTPGQEFDIVSVSIDPRETWQRARDTRQRYLQSYGRPGSGDGWHFLTGSQESIDRLAETVGFQYRYLPERREYAHAAVFMICTPSGQVSRYLYGVEFVPQTLKLSLVEAGEGKIGSTMDQILLYCFHYDAEAGRYGPTARNLMKVGGVATFLALAMFLAPVWIRSHRKPAAEHAA